MECITLPLIGIGSVTLDAVPLELVGGSCRAVVPPEGDTYILSDALLTENGLVIMSENAVPIIQE